MKYLILKPPPEAYKYKQEFSAEAFKHPDNLAKKTKSFGGVTKEVRYFENDDGISVYSDLAFPSEGIPYTELLLAMNAVKSMIVVWLFSFNPFTAKKVKSIFVNKAHSILAPHFLLPVFNSKFERTLFEFFQILFGSFKTGEEGYKLAEMLSCIFSKDSAYRYILGDAFSEILFPRILKNPIKEIWRIGGLVEERFLNPDQKKKFRMAKYALVLWLCFSKNRGNLIKALNSCPLENLQFTTRERYLTSFITFYDFGGYPLSQRMRMFFWPYHKDKKNND